MLSQRQAGIYCEMRRLATRLYLIYSACLYPMWPDVLMFAPGFANKRKVVAERKSDCTFYDVVRHLFSSQKYDQWREKYNNIKIERRIKQKYSAND